MPLYFFHCTDGYVEHDNEGTELPDNHTAQIEAVRLAGESLKDEPTKIHAGQDLRVEVTTEDGTLLYTVSVTAIGPPNLVRQLKSASRQYRLQVSRLSTEILGRLLGPLSPSRRARLFGFNGRRSNPFVRRLTL